MPVYVYKNLTTGETFEVQQSIKESAWTEHPETGDPVKRIVQPVGIAFKGSGFYVTDSRKSSNGKAATASSKGETAGGSEASSGASGADASTPSTKHGSAKESSGSKPATTGGSSSSGTSSSS